MLKNNFGGKLRFRKFLRKQFSHIGDPLNKEMTNIAEFDEQTFLE